MPHSIQHSDNNFQNDKERKFCYVQMWKRRSIDNCGARLFCKKLQPLSFLFTIPSDNVLYSRLYVTIHVIISSSNVRWFYYWWKSAVLKWNSMNSKAKYTILSYTVFPINGINIQNIIFWWLITGDEIGRWSATVAANFEGRRWSKNTEDQPKENKKAGLLTRPTGPHNVSSI